MIIPEEGYRVSGALRNCVPTTTRTRAGSATTVAEFRGSGGTLHMDADSAGTSAIPNSRAPHRFDPERTLFYECVAARFGCILDPVKNWIGDAASKNDVVGGQSVSTAGAGRGIVRVLDNQMYGPTGTATSLYPTDSHVTTHGVEPIEH